jgi:hypothetical protein
MLATRIANSVIQLPRESRLYEPISIPAAMARAVLEGL